jgi:hypothetical protein
MLISICKLLLKELATIIASYKLDLAYTTI